MHSVASPEFSGLRGFKRKAMLSMVVECGGKAFEGKLLQDTSQGGKLK